MGIVFDIFNYGRRWLSTEQDRWPGNILLLCILCRLIGQVVILLFVPFHVHLFNVNKTDLDFDFNCFQTMRTILCVGAPSSSYEVALDSKCGEVFDNSPLLSSTCTILRLVDRSANVAHYVLVRWHSLTGRSYLALLLSLLFSFLKIPLLPEDMISSFATVEIFGLPVGREVYCCLTGAFSLFYRPTVNIDWLLLLLLIFGHISFAGLVLLKMNGGKALSRLVMILLTRCSASKGQPQLYDALVT